MVKLMTWLQKLPVPPMWLLILEGYAFARIAYVLGCTNYRQFLVTDMGGYYNRAVEWSNGDYHGISQWAVWPPGYHVLLGSLFRLLHSLHVVAANWLPFVLIIQICLSVSTIAAVYLIAKTMFRRRMYAVVVAALYGLTYQLVYLDPFVLSEQIAIPLMMWAVAVVFVSSSSRSQVLAGLMMGISVLVRPAFLIYALALGVYMVCTRRSSCWRYQLPVIASICAGCALMAFMSGGRLTHLSGNTGLNFAIAQCHIRDIRFNVTDLGAHYVFGIGSPQFSDDRSAKSVVTEIAPWDNRHWMSVGWGAVYGGGRWLYQLAQIPKLWLGSPMPTVQTPLGSSLVDRASSIGEYLLILTGIIGFSWRRKKRLIQLTVEDWLLLGFVASTAIVGYLFGCQRRYSYPVDFAVLILAARVVTSKAESQRARIAVASEYTGSLAVAQAFTTRGRAARPGYDRLVWVAKAVFP